MDGADWIASDFRGSPTEAAFLRCLHALLPRTCHSHRELADYMKVSPRTVRRTSASLQAAGLLVVEHRRTADGGHDANRYRPIPPFRTL